MEERLYDFSRLSESQRKFLSFLYKEKALGVYLKETIENRNYIPCLAPACSFTPIENFLDSINLSFNWDYSSEGRLFWSTLFKKLRESSYDKI